MVKCCSLHEPLSGATHCSLCHTNYSVLTGHTCKGDIIVESSPFQRLIAIGEVLKQDPLLVVVDLTKLKKELTSILSSL